MDSEQSIDIEEKSDVPKYFESQLKSKEESINKAISEASGNSASFVFFTDAHWGNNQKNSPSLINHIINNTPINDVVFGGDVITTFFKNPSEAFNLIKDFRYAFDTLKCNMYYLYGNHDNNSDSQPDAISRHLSENQVFESLQNGMGTCFYGGFYNFYFDQRLSRTRFICLDTGRFYYKSYRDKTLNTVSFLIKVLADTPDNWSIVVISHIWCDLAYNSENIREPFIPAYFQSFIKVLDDFNAGYKGRYEYNGSFIDYDFSSVTSKVICCIGGHNHLDALLFSNGNIPIIINTTDSQQTINGASSMAGTVNEQSVSAFVVDYKNLIISRYRIGRGEDLSLMLSL